MSKIAFVLRKTQVSVVGAHDHVWPRPVIEWVAGSCGLLSATPAFYPIIPCVQSAYVSFLGFRVQFHDSLISWIRLIAA